jgi:molecular chaperone DnaK
VVEAKNHAEGLIHSTEKSLAEYGSKVSAADKSAIESAVADLKGVLESGDAEAIKSRTQALAEAAMKLGEAMYAASQAGAEAQPGTQGDDVVDADFEEVKDDKKSA